MLPCTRFLVVGTRIVCVLEFLDWLGTVVGARAPPGQSSAGTGCSRPRFIESRSRTRLDPGQVQHGMTGVWALCNAQDKEEK